MKFSIALAQINTKLGKVSSNLEKHLNYIENAKKEKTDLIIFPELALTGYALQDLVSSVVIHPTQNDPIFKKLLNASKEIDIVTSFVHEDQRNRFYIAAVYLSKGELIHIHRKLFLPTYGMFDEKRFFASGNQINAFDTQFGRFGLLICEDFWHVSPPHILWLDGADVMLFISASPGRGLTAAPQLESAHWVDHINQAYSSLFTTFVVHTNRVGFEDGINFWGGATIHDPNGDLIVKAPEYEEALTIREIDLNQLHRTRAKIPLLRDERPALIYKELSRILGK